jgi:tetratricopeptide (TPR) repeat protein
MLLIQKMNERLESSKNDSDTLFFLDLMLAGEQLTKLVTVGLVTCVTDDNKRHRYSQEYRLLRADGIGEWSSVIDEVLTGISSQFFNPVVNHLQRELTERLGSNSWQHKSVEELINCLKIVDSASEPIQAKVAGKTWFSLFAHLRNKTKGHGAYPSEVYSKICVHLCESIKHICNNYSLLTNIEWVYLHRNLSGKYKVSDISNNATRFHYLKTDRNPNFENGVYVFLNKPTKVELLETNSDLIDFSFPNGGFNNKRYETLSYITGNKNFSDASSYLTPPGDLPSSETEGLGKLDLIGNTFNNLPTSMQSYIKRDELELELKKTLKDDRHPIITLTGRGGIGKTSLAISVLNELCYETRFSAIIWFSARDIDLLMEGAKPVKPHVFTSDDISKEYIRLIEPNESKEKGFKPKAFMEKEFGLSSIGPTLFIFDNFETVKDPIDLFQWIDTYIRNPNKVLITSRFRDFKADYPIEVAGMNEKEFKQLVTLTAESLGITGLINSPNYLEELYNESDGHPYVIKVLLGEVAKEGKIGKIKRIVAGKDEILVALFERTFSGLTPAAKRIFLTLSNWRSTIPEIAIEAILMREANEHMDVEKAIEELYKSSLINIEKSEKDGMRFISVPLSASVFGKKKLSVSPMKTAIEADTKLLHTFGVGLNSEIHLGIEPRIIKFFRDIAKRVNFGTDKIENYIPILEFICRKYPYAWLTLASLYEEEGRLNNAISALQSFLEFTEDEYEKLNSWQKLANLYSKNKDWNGEMHSLIELCELKNAPVENITSSIHRMNYLLKSSKFQADSAEKELLVERIKKIFKVRFENINGDASDYSQLAWLHIHINDIKSAKKAIQIGLDIDSNNHHCLKLKDTLNMH